MKQQDKKVEKKDNKKSKEAPSKNKKKVVEDETYENEDQKAKDLAAASLKSQQTLKQAMQTPHFGALSNVPPNLTPEGQSRLGNFITGLKKQIWQQK